MSPLQKKRELFFLEKFPTNYPPNFAGSPSEFVGISLHLTCFFTSEHSRCRVDLPFK
jgi:hypothetical protein